jgi:hypothetical protein
MLRGLVGGKVRSNNGCYTCRLRRKKCDENRPICMGCQSLEITCYFGETKPDWMDNGPKQKQMAEKIKAQVKKQATQRRDRKYLEILETGTQGVSLSDDPALARHMDQHAMSAGASDTDPNSYSGLDNGSTPPSSNTSGQSPPEIPWHNQLFLRQADTDKGPDLDVHFVMIYLDHVFPYLFPFYRPPLLVGGRGWILETIQSNKVVHHTAISLASYFFSVAMANGAREHIECTSRMVKNLGLQLELGIHELQRDVQAFAMGKVSLREGLVILHSIVQMLIFEISSNSNESWKPHLDGAIALFMQLIPRPEHWADALTSFYRELWPPDVPDEDRRPWSTGQAALRFFSANLFYIDVMSGISLGIAPRLQGYQGTIIPGCHHVDDDVPNKFLPHMFHSAGPLAMEEFRGLSNWVLQMVGDVASLHSWKKAQSRAGLLDRQELSIRGTTIEASINAGLGMVESFNQSVSSPPGMPNHSMLDPLSEIRRTANVATSPELTMLNLIWLSATRTYLYTVMHGWKPSHSDIRQSVIMTRDYLLNLPNPADLKNVVWPYCITGCLSPPEDEAPLRALGSRLGPLQVIGTLKSAVDVTEKIWEMRDQIDENWDMPQTLSVLGHKVLLI